jgi:hypothetical protein
MPRRTVEAVPLRSENSRMDAKPSSGQAAQRPPEPREREYASVAERSSLQSDFTPRTFNTEDLDIPPFLRGKRK